MRNRVITLMDTRSGRLSITGWTGVQKSGYSDVFKEMKRKIRHASEALTVVVVVEETSAKSGYGNLSIKCCPQCGTFVLRTQCCCLHCGMIATYLGGRSELTFSAESILEQQSVVAVTAVGSARRSGAEAPVTPPRTVVK